MDGSVAVALVRHMTALFGAMGSNKPDFNASRWGVDRYSDGLVGIQWLLDQVEHLIGHSIEHSIEHSIGSDIRTNRRDI